MAIRIPLTRGKFALVDDADADLVAGRKWYAARCSTTIENYYASARDVVGGKATTIYMHRILLSAGKGSQVDHANGDGLDNRRENIRLCTPSLNVANCRRDPGITGLRGVYLDKRYEGRWIARITANGRDSFLGRFDSPRAAAMAYDDAAIRAFGEFARPNFPRHAT